MTENKASPDERNQASPWTMLHSKELLRPPKGPGVPIVLKHPIHTVGSGSLPPKIFRTGESSVLSRVKTFLPQLEQADAELKQRLQTEPPECVSIENVAEEEECIVMDLAVVELPESPCSSDCGEGSSCSSEEESTTSSDDDSLNNDQDGIRLTRPQKRKRTHIEEM